MDLSAGSDNGKRPGDLTFAWTVTKMFAERRLSLEQQLEIADHGRAASASSRTVPYTYAGPYRSIAARSRVRLGLDFVAPCRFAPLAAVGRDAGAGRSSPRIADSSGHDLDRFEVRCDRPLPLQADGEDLGDVEHVVFEAERGAVSVLV